MTASTRLGLAPLGLLVGGLVAAGVLLATHPRPAPPLVGACDWAPALDAGEGT